MKNRARTIAMSGLVMGLALGLSGCFGKAGSVSVTGGETEIIITAPRGYDTLAVAEGHCGVLKERPCSTVGAKVEAAISSPSLNAWYGDAGLKIL
jgi:hypothetical protein